MSQTMTSSELEVLFIEKLQLKYSLTERDLKKAFSRFDNDADGLLDMSEIGSAVRLMLNGVTDMQIRCLVERFDINGDGKISYDEFLHYLINARDKPQARAKSNDKKGASQSYGDSNSVRRTDQAMNDNEADGYINKSKYRNNMDTTVEDSVTSSRDRKLAPSRRDGGSSQQQTTTRRNGSAVERSRDDSRTYSRDDRDSAFDSQDFDQEEDYDEYPRNVRNQTMDEPSNQLKRSQVEKYSYDRTSNATSDSSSDIASNFNPSNSSELEYRCKMFLENLQSHLNRTAIAMRDNGELSNHLTMSSRELLERAGRSILSKAFQSYTGADSGKARARREDMVVELGDFLRVMRGFKFSGFVPVRTEVLRYLFELCRHTKNASGPSTAAIVGRWDLGNGVVGAADIDRLCDLLYGESAQSIRQQQLPRNQAPAPVGEQTGQRIRDQDHLRSYADRADQKRTDLARGPFKTDPGPGPAVDGEVGLAAIPLRFLSRKSFTSLAAPSNFDAALLKRSMALPAAECSREHVFGLSHSMTGTCIYAMPPQTRPSGIMERPGTSASSSYSLSHSSSALGAQTMSARGDVTRKGGPTSNTNAKLVYASAALGVVHDLATNKQKLFAGHSNDITCIALSNSGALAATGQTGKDAVVHIWSTTSTPKRTQSSRKYDTESDLIISIGKGFFSRSVCAAAFSSDDVYLAAIGCDDHHTMGIWSASSGALLAQAVCQNGLPPQIKDLKWSPGQQFTEFVTRDHQGACDLLCTAGDRHLRLWSFSRSKSAPGAPVVAGRALAPQPSAPHSLRYRGAVMGKSQATAAKVYTCCAFVPCDEKGDKTFDMVAGGSNGLVYLWRAGELAAFTSTIKGGVKCLHIPPGAGDKIYCGGARGMVKVLDSRTLVILASFSTRISISAPSRAECWGAYTDTASRARGSSSGRATAEAGGGMMSNRGMVGSRPHSATSGTPARAVSTGRLRSTTAGTSSRSRVGDIINHVPVVSDVAPLLADVTGIVAIQGLGKSSASQSLALAQSVYVIVTSADGRAVRIDVGSALNSYTSTPTGTGSRPRGGAGLSTVRARANDGTVSVPVKDLFHFHSGSVWGLTTERRPGGSLVATVGEDKQLCVWDTDGYYLSCRAPLAASARCCHFDRYSNFIAVGSIGGGVYVYSHLVACSNSSSPAIRECAYQKDFQEEISDIKFSPSNTCLAVGSHDNFIIVYSCVLAVDGSARSASSGSCELRPLHKLKGHSAYITHLDWSADSCLLRSNCGAYELLYWDAESGKRYMDRNSRDIRWKTHTCTLGFQVMGIWPKYADGTDINALDVCCEMGVVATAGDSGYLNILNFPAVVQEAPRRAYGGHSSFVQNVRFLAAPLDSGCDQRLASAGGDDCAVIIWSLRTTGA